MPALSLSLLGTFQAQDAEGRAIRFETNKTRALLAYLVVENRPHTRLHLAGLLWPDWTETAARTYLRQALLNLRQLLEPLPGSPLYLLSTRHAIQFNHESDYWLDVALLSRALSATSNFPDGGARAEGIRYLEEAVALYRGDFLAGLYLNGCAAFEEWQLLTRENLRRQVIEAARFLAQWYEQSGDGPESERYTRRSLEFDPLLEESHLRLMRLLAQRGDRNGALLHFERYRRQLFVELGAMPSREMTRLQASINAGSLPMTGVSRAGVPFDFSSGVNGLPAFLRELPPARGIAPLCVARERELGALRAHLDAAVAGAGNAFFIAGEAGRGKTVLLRAFAALAQDKYPQLLIAGGECSSHEGVGDALLPFREILGQITGDFEAQWAAGAISQQQARSLWQGFPLVVEALLTYGPHLADTLIPGRALLTRVELLENGGALRRQLELLSRSRAPVSQQHALFDQLTRVLQAVARRRPLFLWIDDLHWADRATSAMLFHLTERIAGHRILIAGAYRPEEIGLSYDGQRHPLDKVVRELRARSGAAHLDLDEADNRPFVDAYIDLEANRLDAAFRDRLYHLSDGHPLFTVELLQTMRERNGLTRDVQGYWIEGPALAWDKLPVRLEAVIGERIERLPSAQRLILDVASVEGDEFTAEVIADTLRGDPQDLIHQLSNVLDRQHHLVGAVDIQSARDSRLSRYRFRHILFQKYLYNSLRPAERASLHENVARSLEARTDGHPEWAGAVAGQLVWHFEQAGMLEQAIPWASLAGKRALEMSANEEAVAYYRWGLTMLATLPQDLRRQAAEADLQMGLGTAVAMADRHASPAAQDALLRVAELSGELNDLPRLFRAMWGLWRFNLVRGDARGGLRLAEQCMVIAEQTSDPALILQAEEAVGCALYRAGRMQEALQHLQEGRRMYAADQHQAHAFLYGQDPGVSCPANEAQVLWYLGLGDQARALMLEALASAEVRGHSASIAFALIFTAGLFQRIGDASSTLAYSERTIKYSRENGFAQWVAVATLYEGWARFNLGETQRGLALTRQGYVATVEAEVIQLRYAALLAAVVGASGQVDEGLALINDLLEKALSLEELEWAAEIYRIKGELLAIHGCCTAAEHFESAIALARRQSAKSLELRAQISLAQWSTAFGEGDAALEGLRTLYGQFTEGFDLPDLRRAGDMLRDRAPTFDVK